MSEKQLQNYVLKKLKQVPNSWWFKPTVTNKRGTPDIIGFIEGYFMAIELKVEGNVPTKIQQYTIDQINKFGGFAFWATSWQEVNSRICNFKRARGIL